MAPSTSSRMPSPAMILLVLVVIAGKTAPPVAGFLREEKDHSAHEVEDARRHDGPARPETERLVVHALEHAPGELGPGEGEQHHHAHDPGIDEPLVHAADQQPEV